MSHVLISDKSFKMLINLRIQSIYAGGCEACRPNSFIESIDIELIDENNKKVTLSSKEKDILFEALNKIKLFQE